MELPFCFRSLQLVAVAYFTASKWAIRHETLMFHDAERGNRPVEVDVAVRRDKELQANAGLIRLPVAILNHGNTVKFTDIPFWRTSLLPAAIWWPASSTIYRPMRRW